MVFIYCRGFRLLKIGCGRISHQVLTIFSHSNFSNPHSHSSFLSPCLLDQKKKRVLGRELGKEKSKKLFRRVWVFVVASHILLKCAVIFYSSRPLCWKHNSSTGTWNGNVEPGGTRDKSMLFEGCWSIIANFWQRHAETVALNFQYWDLMKVRPLQLLAWWIYLMCRHTQGSQCLCNTML